MQAYMQTTYTSNVCCGITNSHAIIINRIEHKTKLLKWITWSILRLIPVLLFIWFTRVLHTIFPYGDQPDENQKALLPSTVNANQSSH